MIQLDLFERQAVKTCGDCPHLGSALDSGVRYCRKFLVWRWPHLAVPDCPETQRGDPERQ